MIKINTPPRAGESQANNTLAAKLQRQAAAPSTTTVGTTAGVRFQPSATETITERTRITIAPRPVGRYELLQPREGGLRTAAAGRLTPFTGRCIRTQGFSSLSRSIP
jgi:hypothetical protein